LVESYGVGSMCRVSLAIYNTADEVETLAEGVKKAVNMLRR
jgi:selenocysteine lyase/cysteine desulfurase